MKAIALMIWVFLVCAIAASTSVAQTKVQTRPIPNPSPTPEPSPTKRNGRNSQPPAGAASPEKSIQSFDYYWEFTQANFQTRKIVIRHDVNGKGEIVFDRKEYEEEVREPIAISPQAMERINSALKSLDFLNSKVNYQYEKDYSHLGNQVFRYRFEGKEAEARINFTTNPKMSAILDEYRRVATQAMWVFDVTLARDTHPLDTPALVTALGDYLKRNEISDPNQLLTFLKEISLDERFPLIARNHAIRLAKTIEGGK